MGLEEKSLRIYDTKKTFFARIGSTFGKIFDPTRNGINNLILNRKRSSVMKAYRQVESAKDNKKETADNNYQSAYSLYLESVDELVIHSIYKKVTNDEASQFEKDAMAKYYNIVHLKEKDENEFKHKKQIYLLSLDLNNVKENKKQKVYDEYLKFYLHEIDQLYKSLLKHYSIKLSEKMDITQKENVYENIFQTLEEYVEKIIPLKEIKDEEIIRQCSLYETYEVGKLDQVDVIDKRMILIALSRKLFTHSLPLVVGEKLYVKLLKDTRALIVDTKITNKRESAYKLLLRLMDQYCDKLLAVKVYWSSDSDKQDFNIFNEKRKQLDKILKTDGLHEYDEQRQILYIRRDMKFLNKYGNKYFRVIKFYKSKLVELGDMRQLKDSYIKFDEIKKYSTVKGFKGAMVNETAC